MKALLWLIIIMLIIIIIGFSAWTILYIVQFENCNNNTSPYCPQYVCPPDTTVGGLGGQAPITYQNCVDQQLCAANLTPPCSLAANNISAN